MAERIDYLVARNLEDLHWAARWLSRGIGAMIRRGGVLASYLLFERSYRQALIDLATRTQGRVVSKSLFFAP